MSGKTTILKALAGNAMCTDGFTELTEPLHFSNLDINALSEKDIEAVIFNKAKNTAIIDWDGAPIYYHNFEKTQMDSRGEFGNLIGSVLGSTQEEVMWLLESHKSSAGQNNMYLIRKLINIASNQRSLKELIEDRFKNWASGNDHWRRCYELQTQHFSVMPKYGEKSPITFLFDELDKSLDVENSWSIFSKIMPELVKKFGVQIIYVTHNPLVLSKNIYGNTDTYNFIPVDEAYTKDMLELLKGVSF